MEAANIFCGYFLTIFFCFSQVWLVEASVTWDMRKETAKQGDDVIVTCTATNIGMFDIVRVSKRSMLGGELSEEEVTVTDSRSLNDPFKSTGRHAVDFTRSTEKVATLRLHFKASAGGIRGEDAGEYKCFSLKDDSTQATLTLKVQVPISEVYLFSIAPGPDGKEARTRLPPGGELVLTHGGEVRTGVGCHASMQGSLDLIEDMKIKIGGSDETGLFQMDPEPTTDDQATDENGFWQYSSQKDLVYTSLQPEEDFNNKQLVCEAHHGGKAWKKVKAKVNLKIEFPPKVTCSQGHQAYATVGEPLQIECEVHANPRANITWNHTEALIDSPREDGPITAQEEAIQEDKIRATLKVEKVSKAEIKAYTLNAENRLGRQAITVNVVEGKEPEEEPVSLNDNPNPHGPGEVKSAGGGASAVIHSRWLHLTSILLLLHAIYRHR